MTKTQIVPADNVALDGFERRAAALERKPTGRSAVTFPLDPLPSVDANGWYRSAIQPTTIESGLGYINWRGLIHWRSPVVATISTVLGPSSFSPPPLTTVTTELMDLSGNRHVATLGFDGSLVLINSVSTSSIDFLLDGIKYPYE